jgi:hypothetical protein
LDEITSIRNRCAVKADPLIFKELNIAINSFL